jgi:cardiolipin synthase
LLSVPNVLSFARLLAVPAMVLLLLNRDYDLAFALFVLAGISDAVDGWWAKTFNARTEFGAYLDPLADKALVVSTYLTLGWLGHIPTWLVLLVVFRDLLIIGGAIVAWLMLGEFRSRPILVSKINTGVQLALVGLLLAELGLGLEIAPLNRALIYVAGVTTVASGFAYLFQWGRRLGHPSGSA